MSRHELEEEQIVFERTKRRKYRIEMTISKRKGQNRKRSVSAEKKESYLPLVLTSAQIVLVFVYQFFILT
jgi:hypothetical protein